MPFFSPRRYQKKNHPSQCETPFFFSFSLVRISESLVLIRETASCIKKKKDVTSLLNQAERNAHLLTAHLEALACAKHAFGDDPLPIPTYWVGHGEAFPDDVVAFYKTPQHNHIKYKRLPTCQLAEMCLLKVFFCGAFFFSLTAAYHPRTCDQHEVKRTVHLYFN